MALHNVQHLDKRSVLQKHVSINRRQSVGVMGEMRCNSASEAVCPVLPGNMQCTLTPTRWQHAMSGKHEPFNSFMSIMNTYASKLNLACLL